jgi:tripeptide aminopeptidase
MNSARLLERFLRYVKIETTADELSGTSPSSPGQLNLSKVLYNELLELGIKNATLSSQGVVFATVPPTVAYHTPTIAFFAHVDTSPEYSAHNVNPIVHTNYDGSDIVLSGDPSKILKVSEQPALKDNIGHSVITTDGTTLLGADDKSGIAAIMTAVEHLLENPEIPRGPIQICFTVDEEIGHGTDAIDISKFKDTACGYTLDSEGACRIDSETFSADLAIVTVHGVNTHPSVGKGILTNATKILSEFLTLLPPEMSPEQTADRIGFIHPYSITGGVAESSCRIILRDFETTRLTEYSELLEKIGEALMEKHPTCRIEVKTQKQYRNMRDGLVKEPRAIANAIKAVEALDREPIMSVIRGGTDGSLLTELGLPTPNLSSGQHNPHSPLEWTSLEEMELAAKTIVELAKLWSHEE